MSFSPNQLIMRKQGFVPDGVYCVLIHSITIDKSSAGNDMASLNCEVISPDEVAHINKQGQVSMYKTGHMTFKCWWTLAMNDFLPANVEKLLELGAEVQDDYPGGPNEMILDLLNQLPDLLSHKYVEASLTSKPQFAHRPLTAKQASEGIKEGDIIIDPATKQPRILRMNVQMNLEGVIAGPSDEATPF